MNGSYYDGRLGLERELKRNKQNNNDSHHDELLCNLAKNAEILFSLNRAIVVTEMDLWSNGRLVGQVDTVVINGIEEILVECKTTYTPENRLIAKQQLKDYLKHMEVKEYELYTAYYQLASDYGLIGCYFIDEEFGPIYLVPEGKWTNYQGKIYPVVEQ